MFYFRIISRLLLQTKFHFGEFKRMNKLLHELQMQKPTATTYIIYIALFLSLIKWFGNRNINYRRWFADFQVVAAVRDLKDLLLIYKNIKHFFQMM